MRGTGQAALLLRDGVSMFEPVLNAGAFNRSLPLETIKSIEVVTGPGGVLWGANSFLGIVNLISKDADDINGLETGVGYGDGDGSPQDFRIWALFGKSFKFKHGPKLSIVAHISYENFVSPRYNGLLTIARSAAPSPSGPEMYGGFADTNPVRAYILNIDGKFTYGPVTLAYSTPIAEMNNSLSFANIISTGTYDPATKGNTGPTNKNYIDIYDRYVTLQYKSRFLKDRVGVDAKLYGIQFIRDLNALVVPGSALLPSGLTITAPLQSYRVGFSVDGDASLPLRNRLLYGGDVFHEWVPSETVSIPGIDPAKLPIGCPLAQFNAATKAATFVPDCPLPFINGTDRTVAALYISDQFRPVSRLILDAGVRYQVGVGQRGYKGANIGGNGQLLGSVSLVWNFYPGHAPEGQLRQRLPRPGVQQHRLKRRARCSSAVTATCSTNRARPFQGEWNARVLKNIGPIRALQLRADYAFTDLDFADRHLERQLHQLGARTA